MFKSYLSIWFQYYKGVTGENYILDSKQGFHLKLIIKKIEIKLKERGLEVNEETMSNSFKMFLSLISDKWILEHLDIALVNSKFNQLYATASKQNPFTQRERLSEIVRNSTGTAE